NVMLSTLDRYFMNLYFMTIHYYSSVG
ncbi:hypothetical protein, partial [Plasmodium yoelii yoelii]